METAFADWLVRQLEERGWSQSEAARRGSFSSAMISGVISGQEKPGLKFCQGIAQAFRMPLGEVFIQAGILPGRRELPAEAADWGNRLARLDDDERKLVIQAMDAVLRLAEMRPSSRRARRSEAESPESPK